MITLQEFRDQTRHLPPDTKLGVTYDEGLENYAIGLRTPDSNGDETVIDCGDLPPIEDEDPS